MAISNRGAGGGVELVGFAILFAGLIAGYLLLSSVESFSGTIDKDDWYTQYSHYACEESIKKQLDDAQSYLKEGNFKLISDDGSDKSIMWTFRSNNRVAQASKISTAVCKISKPKMRTNAAYVTIS